MIEISLARLSLMILPLLAVAWLMRKWSGSSRELVIASARMVVQLLLVGHLLIFLFEGNQGWLTSLVVLFMMGVSAWIAVRTIREQRRQAFLDALWAISLGGGSVFLLVVFGVLQGGENFSARFVVPIAGMIFANAMTAVTLSAERYEAELRNGQVRHLARQAAWNASLIPQINSFLAVGLVSLPGMMTGQILAGASPLEAVRYQILVMAMILGSAGLAVALFLTRRARLAPQEGR